MCRCLDDEYYVSQGWNVSDGGQGRCRPGLTFPTCDSDFCQPSTRRPSGPPVYSLSIPLHLLLSVLADT